MPANQDDFRRQDFIEAGLRLRRYELEMQWDAMHGPAARSSAAAPIASESPLDSQLLTRAQACKLLAVSPATIDRLRQRGQLKPVARLLPMVRFKREDLEALKTNRR